MIRIIWEHRHRWVDFDESPEFIGQRCTRCKAQRSIVVVHAKDWKPETHVVRSTPTLPRQPGETGVGPPFRPLPPTAMDFIR